MQTGEDPTLILLEWAVGVGGWSGMLHICVCISGGICVACQYGFLSDSSANPNRRAAVLDLALVLSCQLVQQAAESASHTVIAQCKGAAVKSLSVKKCAKMTCLCNTFEIQVCKTHNMQFVHLSFGGMASI